MFVNVKAHRAQPHGPTEDRKARQATRMQEVKQLQDQCLVIRAENRSRARFGINNVARRRPVARVECIASRGGT